MGISAKNNTFARDLFKAFQQFEKMDSSLVDKKPIRSHMLNYIRAYIPTKELFDVVYRFYKSEDIENEWDTVYNYLEFYQYEDGKFNEEEVHIFYEILVSCLEQLIRQHGVRLDTMLPFSV